MVLANCLTDYFGCKIIYSLKAFPVSHFDVTNFACFRSQINIINFLEF